MPHQRQLTQRVREESGISRRGLKRALNGLASKRHEEVTAAAQSDEETAAQSGDRGASGALRDFLDEVELLVHYTEEVELFRTPDGRPHATFGVDSHRET